MTPVPLPQPQGPYRGPLRWLDGVPDTTELAVMAGLLVAGLASLFVAKRLFLTYFRDWLQVGDASAWQLLWGVLTLGAGGGSLSWLWLQLEHIAARMGMPIAVVTLLLLAEIWPGRGRRR
ncbi:hypothetical protein [Ornithinimicrobium sp. LYQ103]|uniref:hypothetical protein n=1 Tax=Ornithinimicrobium sp. LYQ103 TaxID=3378796 RepID=UPI0038520805